METDKLKKMALAAEIISAVAIVITLAFLAIETRGNTNAIQAQTYQELMRDINDRRLAVSTPEYGEINKKFREDGISGLTFAEKRYNLEHQQNALLNVLR